MLWPSGDVQKSKRSRREAGEWEAEAENELKQKVGRTSLQSTSFFQALAEKGASRRENEMGLMKYRSEVVSPLHQGLQARTRYLCFISSFFRLWLQRRAG